jgi:hypothetical protein
MKKPCDRYLHDGVAKCVNEDYDDKGGGAFGVEVDVFLYSSQEVEKLIKFLEKARFWIAMKELKQLKNKKGDLT